jgi:hypothetical protein
MCDSFPVRAQNKRTASQQLPNDGEPTSIENKTPPIGEPKATATPAALAAVRISLILPMKCHAIRETAI